MTIEGEQLRFVRDWEILLNLNRVLERRTLRRDDAPTQSSNSEALIQLTESASEFVNEHLASLELPYSHPEITLLASVVPST